MNRSIKTLTYIIELAGDFRKNMTESEKKLSPVLRMKKIYRYTFRSQYPIYRYILDFYCHEKRLAIEIDGKKHKNKF